MIVVTDFQVKMIAEKMEVKLIIVMTLTKLMIKDKNIYHVHENF